MKEGTVMAKFQKKTPAAVETPATQPTPPPVEPATAPTEPPPPPVETNPQPAQASGGHGRGRPPTARTADGAPIVDPDTGKPMSARDPRAAALGAVNAEGKDSTPAQASAPKSSGKKKPPPAASRERVQAATAVASDVATTVATTVPSPDELRRKIAIGAPSLAAVLGRPLAKATQYGVNALGGPSLGDIQVKSIRTVPVLDERGQCVAGEVKIVDTDCNDALAYALAEVLALYMPAVPDAAWAPAAATGISVAAAILAAWGAAK